MKHLAAMGVIVETGLDEYRRNGFSTSLAIERYSDGFPCMCVLFSSLSLSLSPPPSLARSLARSFSFRSFLLKQCITDSAIERVAS